MKFFFFGFLIPIALHSSAQISIEHIRIPTEKNFYHKSDSSIRYPIFRATNDTLEQYMNTLISDRIISDDYQTDSTGRNLTTAEQLREWSDDGLDYMDYVVRLFRNNLLSIEFTIEGTGAYTTTWKDQINIDLQAKKVLSFEDIIQPGKIEELKKIIHQTKLKALEENIEEVESREGATSYLDWARRETQNCIEDDSIENFLFDEKNILFIDDCDFPHAVQSLGPSYDLIYDYSEMKNYLKPEFLKRITE